MHKAILFVDDEKNVLNALRRAFIDTDYTLFFAQSTEDALAILKRETIALVISDMKMPTINGYEFLTLVRKKYPSAIRVILSGYAEKRSIFKAVADGTAKAYMTKPWDNRKLLDQTAYLFTMYDQLNRKGIMDAINQIGSMPVLPSIYNKLLELIQKDSDIEDIAAFIAQDPGLVARILNIVNSSFYGVRIGSIKQAVIYIGLDSLKNIILSSEVFRSFKEKVLSNTFIDLIWNHSNVTNKILHDLYFRIHSKKIPEEFASVGLLHDIGRLLMLRYFPTHLERINQLWQGNQEKTLIEIEQEILGATHTRLGAYLLNWWNLPSYLVEGCLFHHEPLEDDIHDREIIALLHIADIYSWKKLNRSQKIQEIDPAVFLRANIDSEEFKEEIEALIKK